MALPAKDCAKLVGGLAVVGVRRAKRRIRAVLFRTPTVDEPAHSVHTTAGTLRLTSVPLERGGPARAHTDVHYRYAVDLDEVRQGYISAQLDRGTASAMVVTSIDGPGPEFHADTVSTAVDLLRRREAWLRRASIALRPADTILACALRLRGFDCEGEVPGYVDDEHGSRRRLWTLLLT